MKWGRVPPPAFHSIFQRCNNKQSANKLADPGCCCSDNGASCINRMALSGYYGAASDVGAGP